VLAVGVRASLFTIAAEEEDENFDWGATVIVNYNSNSHVKPLFLTIRAPNSESPQLLRF
jgi:hypothetical protein